MKKTTACMAFMVAMGTSAFSMDSNKDNMVESHNHSIFVDFSPEIVEVVKMNGSISVSPKTDQLVINYKAYSEFGSHFLNITKGAEDISSPFLVDVRNSVLQRLVLQNPTRLNVRTDFTIDDFVSTDSYHVIHNNGYLIAGNKQTYDRSTFAFEPNGGIKLNPSSMGAQGLDRIASVQDNPLTALFGIGLKLAATHISSQDVYTTHQGTVNPDCSISSITARPYGATKREAPIHGKITYGDSFEMNLSLQDVVLDLLPNKGFQFEILL